MHPPLLWLLLSVVVAACLALQHRTTAAVTSCAPRACDNLTIAYPFWLPDQPSSAASTACGPPAFQVNCTNGRASLVRSYHGGYKILSVSYANRTVVVANDNVQTDGSGCPVPQIDVSAVEQLVRIYNLSPVTRV
ncbi:hypothetical protein ABZP36_016202 [Zizania latifolia]